jgi:dihydrofolate reductase
MTQKLPFTLTAVVAFDKNFGIGKDNQLLWHLPNDLKHFKSLTLNKNILMGRKTYESIGRPLPNRRMIVLTRNKDFHSDYATVIHDLNKLKDVIVPTDELMLIGGAELYQLCLPYTDKIYATEVDAEIKDADAFFPKLNETAWKRASEEYHSKDEHHNYNYTFVTLTKNAT